MIIIDSYDPAPHGHSVRSPYVLFADTKAEVPQTGAATKPLVSGLTDNLPPTTLIYTKNFESAVLGTDDVWSWKG